MSYRAYWLRFLAAFLAVGPVLAGGGYGPYGYPSGGTRRHAWEEPSGKPSLWDVLAGDIVQFYSCRRLQRVAAGIAVGAVMANTKADQSLQAWYQEHVRTDVLDDVGGVVKWFGEGQYTLALTALAGSFHWIDDASPVGQWGVQCLRAYVLGGPLMLFLQRATGGSRPEEIHRPSKWRFFVDDNGVSGHAFMGAVPFLVLAHMSGDNPVLRYAAYAASLATAWSRVNENAHFPSQAAMGWYLAWESVGAVFEADRKRENLVLTPLVHPEGFGMTVSMSW